MSRSGYTDDIDDQWRHIMWRGAVASALRGKRGQAFLREALVALDALPEPKLIANNLRTPSGEFCTLGAVGDARGLSTATVDPEDQDAVAGLFNIPHALACEIMWENDEAGRWNETPEQRWQRMRAWIAGQIKPETPQ